jgi:hypothetical protein
MLLSEAIRLGSALTYKVKQDLWDGGDGTCSLGSALDAVGRLDELKPLILAIKALVEEGGDVGAGNYLLANIDRVMKRRATEIEYARKFARVLREAFPYSERKIKVTPEHVAMMYPGGGYMAPYGTNLNECSLADLVWRLNDRTEMTREEIADIVEEYEVQLGVFPESVTSESEETKAMLQTREFTKEEMSQFRHLREKYKAGRRVKARELPTLRVVYSQQGNFTVAIITQNSKGSIRAVGVSKRNPGDEFDPVAGQSRAFGRAALTALGVERSWASPEGNGHHG